MKNPLSTMLASATLSILLASGANAQSFGDCVSTNRVTFDGSIVDAAIATPELSTLVDLVVAAGLDEALATIEDITVFAPTNDAFAALPPELVDVVVGNTDLLTEILTYHVTAGHPDPRKVAGAVAQRKETLQGQSVYFSRSEGEPRVNNAGVSCTGVQTDNGSVWIIDSVLLPAL
ncbi:fasciclin domain-containing protein [Seongchinamella unica]|uniref:Fasciclin domain-containing protein n=1 Tax=Seongchinamella unica TaxID=2547392 RepID=A0A4R5LN48_9GAMM|nr:fasciclin domain-containing protein [Seongchinamella unica]TDG11637.1 fasciclin domain-containing protein [Seongchinamella unica]